MKPNSRSSWLDNLLSLSIVLWGGYLSTRYLWNAEHSLFLPPRVAASIILHGLNTYAYAVMAAILCFVLLLSWSGLNHLARTHAGVKWLQAMLGLAMGGVLIRSTMHYSVKYGDLFNVDAMKIVALLISVFLLLPLFEAILPILQNPLSRISSTIACGVIIVFLLVYTSATREIVAILVVNVIAWALGRRILERLGLKNDCHGLEELFVALSIGLTLFAAFAFWLGLFGMWYRWVAFSILGILAFVLRGSLQEIFTRKNWEGEGSSYLGSLSFVEKCVLGFAIVVYLISFVGALAPETNSDAIGHHLAIAARMSLEHRLTMWPQFLSMQSAHGSTLYAWGTLLASPIAGKIQNVVFGLILAAGFLVFSRRYLHPKAGVWALAMWCASSLVGGLLLTAYVDMMAVSYALVSTFVLFLWIETRNRNWLVPLGFGLGTLIATKQASYTVVLPVVLVLLVFLFIDSRRHWKKIIAGAVWCALSAAVICLPWMVRTWWLTGNPVFPTLNNVFRSPLWEPVNEVFGTDQLWGTGRTLKSVLRLPLDLVFHPNRFSEAGTIGPAFLMLIPALLCIRQWRRWPFYLMGCIVLVSTLQWVIGIQYLRWFLLFLPLWFLLGGCGIAGLMAGRSARLLKTSAVVMVATVILTGFGADAIATSWWLHGQSGAGMPYKVAFRMESRDTYLRRVTWDYPVIDYLNRSYSHPKVLSLEIRNHLYPRVLFDGDVHAILPVRQRTTDIIRSGSEQAAWEDLLRNGYTHILINVNDRMFKGLKANGTLIYTDDFMRRYLVLEYARWAVYLFRVRRPDELPMRWEGGKDLIGSLQALQSNGPISISETSVHPNDLYLLTFSARGEPGDGLISTSIHWMDDTKRVMEGSRVDHRVGPRSEQYWRAETAPPGARSAQIIVWSDDASSFKDKHFINLTQLNSCP